MKTLLAILLLAVSAFAQYGGDKSNVSSIYSLTATFLEPFTGYSESCAGSSSCKNLFLTTAGTTASIVSSSGVCGGGWTDANILKLAPNATAPAVASYGTIPDVPSGSNLDITWQMCWDSSTWNHVQTELAFQRVSGGGFAFGIAAAGSGSNNWYANGATPFSGGSASTTHTFHMNRTSSTCEIQVDGGSFTTFTCDNVDSNELVLGGFSSGANLYIGHVYINSASYQAGVWPPSAFSDWAGMTGTPTAAQLLAGTHCGNANAADWAEDSLTGVTFSTSTGGTSFPTPLTVCGATYSGNTNISLEASVTTVGSSSGGWNVTYNTAYPSAQWGQEFWYTGGPAPATGFDFAAIGGTIYTLRILHVGGNDEFCLETNSNSTNVCIASAISTGTHYWLSIGVSPTGNDTLYVYTLSPLTLFGSVAGGGTPVTFTPGQLKLSFGKEGSETLTNAIQAFTTNWIVQYADGTAPALPPH